MKKSLSIPPCPDPSSYILVQTREGTFWRRKRGLGPKGVQLNNSFRISAEGMGLTAPAAKNIVNKLKPYLQNLATGRITVRISGNLRKQYNRNGKIDYTYLKGLDLQPDHPLEQLLSAPPIVQTSNEGLIIKLPVHRNTISKSDDLITDYFAEVIFISGNCSDSECLVVQSKKSEVYQLNFEGHEECSFSFPLVKHPWIAVLKVSCRRNGILSVSPGDYGMKIIAVG